MTSTRLPGKVMMEVLGKPLLGYELERAARSRKISAITVATTVNATDDTVAKYASSLGFGVFRGSEDDVLGRFAGAVRASPEPPDFVLRLTADCPLIDPEVIDLVIGKIEGGGYDYVSDVFERRTYPRGLDAEVFTTDALYKACSEAKSQPEREHVTPYIIGHPEVFRLGGVFNSASLGDCRWTVDTIEDFELARSVIEALYPVNPTFSFRDVLEFLNAHPEIAALNRHVKQK
jgi:spore coat polysaccharide biosynthesis protein SpsF